MVKWGRERIADLLRWILGGILWEAGRSCLALECRLNDSVKWNIMTLTPPGQTAGVIQTLRFDAAWEIHQFRGSGGNLYALLGGLPCRGGENHDLRKT